MRGNSVWDIIYTFVTSKAGLTKGVVSQRGVLLNCVHVYMYVHTYMCVCVHVCACMRGYSYMHIIHVCVRECVILVN